MNKHVITAQNRRTVESMAQYGIPPKQIAHAIGCGVNILYAHYRDDMERGSTAANAVVLTHLFHLATLKMQVKEKDQKGNEVLVEKPDPKSAQPAMFWARSRCGWRDNHVEVSGPDGGPIQMVDFTKLTDEQLAALEPVLTALVDSSGDGGGASPPESGAGETVH